MNSGWQDRREDWDRDRRRGTAVFGILLVAVGVFFLASEQFGADLGKFGWPIFVIAPGLFLLVLGLAIPHEGGLGAAIPGGILTSLGFVLALQTATDTYASWAYAWAIVAPGSVGLTLMLFGMLHRRRDLFDAGVRTAATGLGLFVCFGLFFESILGIDDLSPNNVFRAGLPLMAVGLGVLIVIWNLLPRRLTRGARQSESAPPTPPPAPPAA